MQMQKTISLNPGESKLVSFAVTPTGVGPHTVSVDGLSGSFTVLEPPAAQFVVSDLIITPAQCYPGELVSISVTVRNIGLVAHSHWVIAKVLLMTKVVKTVGLAPGEAKLVEFQFRPMEARIYQVSVDGLSGSFIVLEPPVAQMVGTG